MDELNKTTTKKKTDLKKGKTMASHSSSSTMYAPIANTVNEFDPSRVSAELKRLRNYYATPKIGTTTTSTSMTLENTNNIKDSFTTTTENSHQQQFRLLSKEQVEFNSTGNKINTEISRPKHTIMFQDLNRIVSKQESLDNVHQNLVQACSSSSTLSSYSYTKGNPYHHQNQSPCPQILNPKNSSTTNQSESNDNQQQIEEKQDGSEMSLLLSCGWKKESSEELALNQNNNSTVDFKQRPQSKTTLINELRSESNTLLTIHPNKNNNNNNPPNDNGGLNEPTIFDLRFEDRQRIANLISQLANSQEQVEILEYRVQKYEEHSRRKINDLMKKVELLSERCKFLVAQNASKFESTGCVLKKRKEKNEENQLKQFQEQNQQLTFQLNQIKINNTNLKHTLSVLESKYHKCTEDNQRLKFILKKIQEREEILLIHNKCYLNSEEEDKKKKESQQTLTSSTKSSESQTEILKPCVISSSFVSSQPYVSETVHEDDDEEENLRLSQLRQRKNDGRQLEKPQSIQNRNKSAGDFCPNNYNNSTSNNIYNPNNNNNNEKNEEEFHEFPVYEPHLVIPSMHSPVIMKIPKSPILMKGRFSVPPPVKVSQNYCQTSNTTGLNTIVHRPQIPPKLVTKLDPTTQSHVIEEKNEEIYTENREESILRELFFTF